MVNNIILYNYLSIKYDFIQAIAACISYLLYKVSGIRTWYISCYDVQATDILITEPVWLKKGKPLPSWPIDIPISCPILELVIL